MNKTIPFLILFLVISCDSVRERREAVTHSTYLKKEFTSLVPMVYLKNLPHVEDVSEYVAKNSPTLIAKEAEYKIEELGNHCTGCLSPDRLVTPIRLVFIPIGKRFEIIDEYLSFRHTPLGPSKIPMLILRDENDNISEISEISFELNFVDYRNRKISVRSSETKTINMLNKFIDVDSVTIKYCPKIKIVKYPDVNKFFHDFHLEDDIKVHEDKPSCESGTTITFYNPESLLTARYYFEEWGLYGQWYVIP
jgi:hypothetical protein